MKRFGPWMLPLLLLLLVAAGLFLEDGAQRGEGRPLADDTRPAGVAAFTRYLQARGHTVEVVREGLPQGGATWVLAAPSGQELSSEQVERLAAFVHEGGALVVLMPGDGAQPNLSGWLQLFPGPDVAPTYTGGLAPSPDVAFTLGVEDSDNAGELLLAPGPTLKMLADGAIPVARHGDAVGLWRWPQGQGAVWVTPGTGLIENRRISLGQHLAFWEGLAARGPLQLIETFHHAGAPPPPSRALQTTLLQLGLCLLFAAWVFGPRLGPPRPTPQVHHRSSLETVRAFGWLLRRSQVEPGLLAAQLEGLRQLAVERLGVPERAPLPEVAMAVETRCGRASAWALAILQALQAASGQERVDPSRYAALARRGAELEHTILGARPASEAERPARERAA